MAAAVTISASQFDLQAVTASVSAAPRASQFATLVAYGPPQAQLARVSQDQLLVVRAGGEADVSPRVSQAVAMAAFGTGTPIEDRADSWTYVLDGHRFWVLPLGPEGDWQYDTITKQWSQLQTNGFPGLNFSHGVMWKLRIVGGDTLYPYLYEMDPSKADDEGWRGVVHTVTGALQTRSNDMLGVANFRCTGSVGTLSDDSTDVNLTFSDDNGKSWIGPFTITLQQGVTNVPLVWSALGSFTAPGRIFQVEDSGGMLSIFGADAAVNNYDEDDNPSGGGNGG